MTKEQRLSLNEAQQKAVRDADGPSLVLAGAGSGKTMVIVERLAWLIGERGVDPRHILALTFTNKAAAQMRDRVAARLGRDRVGAWLGTFHSFGLWFLRREIEQLGRKPTFTVFDDTDQLSLMKKLVKELPNGPAHITPREALTWISRLKQNLEKPNKDESPASKAEELCRVLWDRYHDALLHAGAVDFDDLLVLTARLLSDHETVRTRYQHRYQYVHIDEYQDTNHAQYTIARLLSEGHGNLFAVGDEDQSIYSWRGATIRNILDFERDFPNAQVFRLEQNYRSTKPILNAANALVSHNEQRLGKTLWTEQAEGETVLFHAVSDGEAEARLVADQIDESGIDLREVAVLYRTNGQARLLEEALRKKGIPYTVLGGVRFYGRKEIKDLLAYLRLVVNPADDVSFSRVINVPPRGLGAVTVARMNEYAALRNMPLMDVARELEHDQTFSARVRNSVAQFVHLMDDLALMARKNKEVAPLIEHLIEQIGYREFIRQSDEKDFRSRIEVVDEFIASCIQADQTEPKGLLSFLQDLSLLSDVDEWDPNTPAVTLMTIHSAKGLEFDHVYLVGLEEGLLPHGNSMDSEDAIEEERRLCYVAMTRARKKLTLTAAHSRLIYGEASDRGFSRFLEEMAPGGVERYKPPKSTSKAAAQPKPKPKSASDVDGDMIKMGTRVRHAKFGAGVVMYSAGSGKRRKVRIRFQTGRVREFMLGVAPIEVLED